MARVTVELGPILTFSRKPDAYYAQRVAALDPWDGHPILESRHFPQLRYAQLWSPDGRIYRIGTATRVGPQLWEAEAYILQDWQ